MTLQILSGLNENNADKNSKVITSSYKNRQSSLKNICHAIFTNVHVQLCIKIPQELHIFFFWKWYLQ